MEIADRNPREMTYKAYKTWSDEARCEVLDGKIISMAPSPIPEHQDISMQLSIEIGTYLRGKTYKTYAAPIDVYLFQDSNRKWIDENVRNWLIPDLIVVCDPDKIKSNKILGAPDLVVEMISPASAKNDRIDKRLAYQRAGVKEYRIIDSANQVIEVYLLKGQTLELSNVYNRGDVVSVQVLEDLTIDTGLLFPEIKES